MLIAESAKPTHAHCNAVSHSAYTIILVMRKRKKLIYCTVTKAANGSDEYHRLETRESLREEL